MVITTLRMIIIIKMMMHPPELFDYWIRLLPS